MERDSIVREILPRSFTYHHVALLEICFGLRNPRDAGPLPHLSEDCLDMDDVNTMARMVLVEFAASLQHAMKGTDETSPDEEPHPFDVFLMETTIDQRGRNIAVCLPTKSTDLVWYMGGHDLYALDDLRKKWRIASLAGPARVIEALQSEHSDLTRGLMARTHLQPPLGENIYSLVLNNHIHDTNILQDVLKMNESQQRAIAAAISPEFRQKFLAVQGPPGTGKSVTLVAMIRAHVARGSNVIVVAPSNAAVANLALRLYATNAFALDEVVVYGKNCDPSVHFLGPEFRGNLFGRFYEDYEASSKNSVLREQLQAEFMRSIRLEGSLSIGELASICPAIDKSTQVGRSRLAEILSCARVVFSTLNSAGSPMLSCNVNADTLMLDEAGQCTEAEFFIASNFPGIERIVAVGDPMQLPATVIDRECEAKGYGRSWLGNIHALRSDMVHLLDTQYRMHPDILAFPNRAFYNSRIKSGANVLSWQSDIQNPFLFIDTSGRGSEERAGHSYQNAYECVVLQSLLRQDEDVLRVLRDNPDSRIIIVSPYKAQTKLIKDQIALKNGGRFNLEVATVDSFQGQEGDVVFLLTVRTHGVGFTDQPNRLNVALTRAKKVLRVVGDKSFFQSKLRHPSVLLRLAKHADIVNCVSKSKIKRAFWAPPNWRQPTLWKASMNQRFINCIRCMSMRDKNLCLNSLLTIATPDMESLGARIPRRDSPGWYTSHLGDTSGDMPRIVWIAKLEKNELQIEAHFAGSKNECLRFIQKYPAVPAGARCVHTDLSGVHSSEPAILNVQNQSHPFASWTLTNSVQRRLYNNENLPSGSLKLDGEQSEVAKSQPPLIIESRSGTGKTLVLLQHSVMFADRLDERPTCFITVSPRLRRQLEEKFNEMSELENQVLPPTLFFSFEDFLMRLAERSNIGQLFGGNYRRCRLRGYLAQLPVQCRPKVDSCLIENEIGGVISGSLESALQRNPLSREQYIASIRSNIGNKRDPHANVRLQVFDVYEGYSNWKKTNAFFDTNDIVLALLGLQLRPLFSAAYLDEVQDLSYAAIFLICSIAGREKLNWVVAGDPAQMISPGCSFNFAGLKNVLFAIQPGIESRLRNVAHLLVNYRTTKDVLTLGNEILDIAKQHWPNTIGFIPPEIAQKDLGLSVVVWDREDALSETIKLGSDQAVIYSSFENERTETEIEDWIGSHPFVMTSLESKGLEFEDVIVLFDLPRTTWLIDRRAEASLRMLRELYVAVTRAQKRVVLIVTSKAMGSFLSDGLSYQFQRAETKAQSKMIRMEFDKETTKETWRRRGLDLFDSSQFLLASRCFAKSDDEGWRYFASGCNLEADGLMKEASISYENALLAFHNARMPQKVLDVALVLFRLKIWKDSYLAIFNAALELDPKHLKATDILEIRIFADDWSHITAKDLSNTSLSRMFKPYRMHKALDAVLDAASETEVQLAAEALPAIVGDYFVGKSRLSDAVRLYSIARDFLGVETTIAEILRLFMSNSTDGTCLHKSVMYCLHQRVQVKDPTVSLLFELFQEPYEVSTQKREILLRELKWRAVILLAWGSLEIELLHDVDRTVYAEEIFNAVEDRFELCPIDGSFWYLERNNRPAAITFAKARVVSSAKNVELCRMGLVLQIASESWFVKEIIKRNLITLFLLSLFGANSISGLEKAGFLTECAAQRAPLTQIEKGLAEAVLLLFPDAKSEHLIETLKIKSAKRAHIDASIGNGSPNIVFHHFSTSKWNLKKLKTIIISLFTIEQILDCDIGQPSGEDENTRTNARTSLSFVYRGIFEAANKKEIIVDVLSSAPEDMKIWLLNTFHRFGVIPKMSRDEFESTMFSLYLSSGLYMEALEVSWNLWPSDWLEIATLWSRILSPEHIQQLLSAQVSHVWQYILVGRGDVQKSFRENGDITYAMLKHLGRSLTTHFRTNRSDEANAGHLLLIKEYQQRFDDCLASRRAHIRMDVQKRLCAVQASRIARKKKPKVEHELTIDPGSNNAPWTRIVPDKTQALAILKKIGVTHRKKTNRYHIPGSNSDEFTLAQLRQRYCSQNITLSANESDGLTISERATWETWVAWANVPPGIQQNMLSTVPLITDITANSFFERLGFVRSDDSGPGFFAPHGSKLETVGPKRFCDLNQLRLWLRGTTNLMAMLKPSVGSEIGNPLNSREILALRLWSTVEPPLPPVGEKEARIVPMDAAIEVTAPRKGLSIKAAEFKPGNVLAKSDETTETSHTTSSNNGTTSNKKNRSRNKRNNNKKKKGKK